LVSGHLGIALAIRASRRDVPLTALIAASILPDMVDGVYRLAGFYNRLGLWSHSLPATAVLTTIAFALALAITRRAGVAVAIALAVLVHLPADLVTGEKLLWARGAIAGLALYDYPLVDFLVEISIAIAGWWVLRRDRSAPRWATGAAAIAIMALLQVAFDIYQFAAER